MYYRPLILGPSKNSHINDPDDSSSFCEGLLSLYIHTLKRFDYGFKYLSPLFLLILASILVLDRQKDDYILLKLAVLANSV